MHPFLGLPWDASPGRESVWLDLLLLPPVLARLLPSSRPPSGGRFSEGWVSFDAKPDASVTAHVSLRRFCFASFFFLTADCYGLCRSHRSERLHHDRVQPPP
ncbi:hypothetical protein [Equine adenovirus 2]|uniref:Uncharacterized protein n=1 Tax=Equine adenovirus B serotype 2 TaxID=67603 RepID=A0A0K1DCR2_ADEE2|nr:hypothetical protein [Equine adenovirus 2]AKT26024.1 hypothetical protein [Equine adenovirus 2]